MIVLRRVGTVLLLAGLGAAGTALWIPAKAMAARQLVARSWAEGRGGITTAPWPGADFRPVLLLSAPALEEEWLVLSDSSVRTLAFGPGLLHRSRGGALVVAGHRDTVFPRLADLRIGDRLRTQAAGAAPRHWQVAELYRGGTELFVPDQLEALMLVTCVPGKPDERLLAVAVPVRM